MNVIKRNGTIEEFTLDKIKTAILKASVASNETISDEKLDEMLEEIDIYDNISIESIQDQVEKLLMRWDFFETSKCYIIYRDKHKEDRDIENLVQFFLDYCKAENAAEGSKFDPNANVTSKNIATLNGELSKDRLIRLNRRLLFRKNKELYGKEFAERYEYLLKNHFIYKNDETNIANYCASITMYPWLLEGTKSIGGNSTPPTNLKSFCGGFVNMVFMVSGMLAGACATPEFLMYMDYFIRKEYGDDYQSKLNEVVDLSKKQRTLEKVITDYFEQVVYSLNQPTGARNFQAVFWNISYYDKYYFDGIFGDFRFPDGTAPIYDSLSGLQKLFMNWFNEERKKTILTFPVETMALLTENGDVKDEDYADFTAEMYSKGHSFFTYSSNNVDSLSSCCRLRNEITENEFSYTLGAGGVSTGSKSVLTINLNRCIQYALKTFGHYEEFLNHVIDLVHKVQISYNENLKSMLESKMLPLFDAGYINLNRQYLTIGINGLVEAAEFLGLEINDNEDYNEYVESILSRVEFFNKKYKTKELMFNCEMIPAENVGVKHAKWDREDGYYAPRDCYNSYFYKVEDDSLSVIDKFKLHGEKYVKHLTGGSANHVNLEEHLTKKQYRQLLKVAAIYGTNYFTFNIPNTICNECDHIDKRYLTKCPKCGSSNIDYLTRVIGYLRRISSFSKGRQIEAKKRNYNTFEEK